MRLKRLTTGHEEFVSWLRMAYPGCEFREFTDSFGCCVEVIEHTELCETVLEVYAVPCTVYHDQDADDLLVIPEINERNFPPSVEYVH